MSYLEVVCRGCGRKPQEIDEYVELAKTEGYANAEEAVKNEEGTYNPKTGQFYCTVCYIENGMPLGKA